MFKVMDTFISLSYHYPVYTLRRSITVAQCVKPLLDMSATPPAVWLRVSACTPAAHMQFLAPGFCCCSHLGISG